MKSETVGGVVRATSKRVPVLVENDTYSRYQAYSQTTGVTVTHAVLQALNEWMDIVGEARMKAHKPGREMLRDNLLRMPSRDKS